MLLAAALKTDELKEWASRELNGYPKDNFEVVPTYRRLYAPARGNFTDGYTFWNCLTIAPGTLPDKSERFAEMVFLSQPIAELEGLVAGAPSSGSLTSPWPGTLIEIMRDKVFDNLRLVEAWQEITKHQIAGVLDTVRSRGLEFTIELGKELPESGDVPAEAVPQATVTHLFHTYIHGLTAVGVPKGDFDALRKALLDVGVVDGDVVELEVAKDEMPTDDQLGPKASGWFAKVAGKIAGGVGGVGKDVAVTIIVKALSAYYGLPS